MSPLRSHENLHTSSSIPSGMLIPCKLRPGLPLVLGRAPPVPPPDLRRAEELLLAVDDLAEEPSPRRDDDDKLPRPPCDARPDIGRN